MTATAYVLASDAWEERGTAENPIRVLRADARYVEAAEPERTPRKSRGLGMAVRSLADVERETRESGGADLALSPNQRRRFGLSGKVPVGNSGGAEKQRARWLEGVLARMAAGGDAMLRSGELVLRSTEIVWRTVGTETRAYYEAVCRPGTCDATVWLLAGPHSRRARDVPKRCQRCARKTKGTQHWGRYREVDRTTEAMT